MTESSKDRDLSPEEIVSGGIKQNKIDEKMKGIVEKFKDLFIGFVRVKGVNRIHIEIDETVKKTSTAEKKTYSTTVLKEV